MFKKWKRRREEKLRIEFLPEALEIIEKPASPLGHLVIWILIVAILAFLTWSILCHVDENAVAQGKLVTSLGIQSVQSEVNGTVKKILIQEGDKVKKGQKLIMMDMPSEKANARYYNSVLKLAKFKMKLLKQMKQDQSISILDFDNPTAQEKDVYEYFVSIKEEKEKEISNCDVQKSQAESALQVEEKNLETYKIKHGILIKEKRRNERKRAITTSEDERLSILKRKVEKQKKKYKQYKKLYEEDIITKVELQEVLEALETDKENVRIQEKIVQAQKKEIEDKTEELGDQLTQLESQILVQEAVVEEKRKAIVNSEKGKENIKAKYDSQIKSMIAEQHDVLTQTKANKKQIDEAIASAVITSPCDGVIQKIAVNTVGAVIPTATKLIDIVPTGTDLIVEANVNNEDIGYVKLGQEVKIKLSTYDYQEFGMLKGTVHYISKDSELQENGKEEYKVKIFIDKKKFLHDNPTAKLQTGMQGTVEIKTGSRRVIDFFLEPLTKHFEESLTVR